MDITNLFKACVKTVRTKNKAFGVGKDADKSRILRNKPKSGFLVRAKDVTCQISKLRDFLSENHGAYCSFYDYMSGGDQMTDADRDQIDVGAQRIMNTCSHLLQDFKKEVRRLNNTVQIQQYMENVIESIENYLKAVCKVHNEQKAMRIKRALDKRKLSKLQISSNTVSLRSRDSLDPISNDLTKEQDDSASDISNTKNSSDVAREMDNALLDDERLTSEELQMYESENTQLFNELNNVSEEVRQIESRVLQIAELQEVFTEKILQQEQDVDRIANTVIGTTENVKDANDQIRQAIQRNAGLRVWVLFFLIVMSFSLLFLDWYND